MHDVEKNPAIRPIKTIIQSHARLASDKVKITVRPYKFILEKSFKINWLAFWRELKKQ